MRTQFIVQEDDIKKREKFFDYIIDNYELKIHYPFKKELFVKSKFPFVIDFEDNTFWICNSIICCTCAAQNNSIFSIKQFKKLRR